MRDRMKERMLYRTAILPGQIAATKAKIRAGNSNYGKRLESLEADLVARNVQIKEHGFENDLAALISLRAKKQAVYLKTQEERLAKIGAERAKALRVELKLLEGGLEEPVPA